MYDWERCGACRIHWCSIPKCQFVLFFQLFFVAQILICTADFPKHWIEYGIKAFALDWLWRVRVKVSLVNFNQIWIKYMRISNIFDFISHEPFRIDTFWRKVNKQSKSHYVFSVSRVICISSAKCAFDKPPNYSYSIHNSIGWKMTIFSWNSATKSATVKLANNLQMQENRTTEVDNE